MREVLMRAAAPTIDHETVEWKIKVVRIAIASSWAELAISGLPEGGPRTPAEAGIGGTQSWE